MENSFVRSVWVSYSGADQNLVEEWAKYIDEHYSKPDQKNNVKPFRLKLYKRHDSVDPEKDSQPIENTEEALSKDGVFYHLRPTETISMLVEVIASNLRRVIVVSPQYLQSRHCLWEFCACLTRTARRETVFLLKGTNGFSSLINLPRDFPSLGLEQVALPLALAETYKNKVKKMHKQFHLSNEEEQDLAGYFKNALEKMEGEFNRQYITDETLNTKQTCDFISAYVNHINANGTKKEFNEFLEEIWNNWRNSYFARWYFGRDECDAFDFEHLVKPDLEKIKKLVHDIRAGLKKCPLEAEDLIEGLKELSGLLALKLIDSEWAAEMRMSSLGGLKIRLSLPDSATGIKRFACQIAAHAIQQVRLELCPSKNYRQGALPEVEGHLRIPAESFEDAVHTTNVDAKRENIVNDLLKDIVVRVMGYSEERAFKLLKEDDWPFSFRAYLEDEDMVKNDRIAVARIFVEENYTNQQQFNDNEFWEQITDSLLRKINSGFDEEDFIDISMVTVSSRDDGNVVELVNTGKPHGVHRLEKNIKDLTECLYEQSNKNQAIKA